MPIVVARKTQPKRKRLKRARPRPAGKGARIRVAKVQNNDDAAPAPPAASRLLSDERRAAIEKLLAAGKGRAELEKQLLAAMKLALPQLEELHAELSSHWGYEDPVYRFYHQSFKVYRLQDTTLRIVEVLRGLLPNRPLNSWFEEIVKAGTGKRFDIEHNQRWLEVTRPILEAFFHARYFVEMACKYARELDTPPQSLPSGWAAFLYLYDLR